MHDIGEFTDPKNYKTYDELKNKLVSVLGEDALGGAPTMREETKLGNSSPPPAMKEAAAPELDDEIPDFSETAEQTSAKKEDDTMSYFANLVND